MFFKLIPGTGLYADRLNGQVLCPKCYANDRIAYMAYDKHIEHGENPMVAADRFYCPECHNWEMLDGKVGVVLLKDDPFGVRGFSFKRLFSKRA